MELGAFPKGLRDLLRCKSDNFISPIDALLVINYLNLRLGGGEGESTLFADPSPLFESADFDLEIASETAATVQSIDDYFADLGRRRK